MALTISSDARLGYNKTAAPRARTLIPTYLPSICIKIQVVNGKPAPDIYLAAANRMGLEPKHCLAFEDALSGVSSAKSAGMFVVAVPDSRLDKKPFWDAGADLVLSSLSEWDPAEWKLEVAGS